MRRKNFWRGGVFVAFAFGGCLGFPPSDLPVIGVSAAEAKDFYTRKRVNGRWVTGRFPKRHAAAKPAPKKPVEEARPAAKPARVITASAPAIDAAPRSPQASQSPPATPAPAAPIQRIETGPQAFASVPQASLPAANNAPLVAPPEDQRLDHLRQALKARASALTTGSIGQPSSPAPEPQSVSLDFKSGMKTTLFSDGTTVREPFDVTAMKGLAAVPPATKIGSK